MLAGEEDIKQISSDQSVTNAVKGFFVGREIWLELEPDISSL